MEDIEIQQRVRKVLSLLENSQKEMEEAKTEVKDFVNSADGFLHRINYQESADKCQVSEIHWQTYSSHDWFAGFKFYGEKEEKLWTEMTGSGSVDLLCEIREVLQDISLLYRSFEEKLSECDKFYDSKESGIEGFEVDGEDKYEIAAESVLENLDSEMDFGSVEFFDVVAESESVGGDKCSLSMSCQSGSFINMLETYFE